VRLVISDKCLGLVEALGECFPQAAWQRCTVHWYRNVLRVVPTGKVKEVVVLLKAIHTQEDREAARARAEQVVTKLKALRLGQTAEVVRSGVLETLAYRSFPREHRARHTFDLANHTAGGQVTVWATTRFDAGNPEAQDPIEQLSCRPDFQVLIYSGSPGSSMGESCVSANTRTSLMVLSSSESGPGTPAGERRLSARLLVKRHLLLDAPRRVFLEVVAVAFERLDRGEQVVG
jgi:hypothetical protein